MSKKKKRFVKPDHLIEIDLYDVSIGVFWSREGAVKSFEKNFDLEIMEDSEGESTCVGHAGYAIPEDGRKRYYIVMTDEADIEHYAHESLHMCEYICEELGIPLSEDTAETRAYLMQYIMRKLLDGSPYMIVKVKDDG